MDNQLSKRTFALVLLMAAIAVSPPTAGAVAAVQFGAATNFPTGNNAGGIVVGDFNRDGKPDIVELTSAGVSVFLNLGNGMLAAPTNSFPRNYYNCAIAMGDFNNDGNLDIVITTHASGSPPQILLGDGHGNFLTETNLPSNFSYSTSVAVGDFNNDGNLDLAVPNDNGVAVASGRGDGSFGVSTNYALGNYAQGDCIRVGGIYRTGRVDLAVSVYSSATSNCFCVLSNNGDGTFASPRYYSAGGRNEYHYSLELGDFNADGKPDVAVLNYNAQSVTIWINSGSGNFAPAHTYALGFSPTRITKADFNGDGNLDLVVRGDGTARLLLGNGDGSFIVTSQMALASDISALYGTSVAVGDFDSDGRPGLAFVNSYTYYSNSVAIMLNQTPPILQFAPVAGYNQITWLATFGTGYTLESTTNLSTPGGWQPFPYPPVVIGNQKAVADWATGEQKFYRLRKP